MHSPTSKLVYFWRTRNHKDSSRPGSQKLHSTRVNNSNTTSRAPQTRPPKIDTAVSELHSADGSDQPITGTYTVVSAQPDRPSVGTQTGAFSPEISTPEPETDDGLRKWFDDGGLENSKEIQALSQSMSDITITAPSNNSNPELAKLIETVNAKSAAGKLRSSEENIKLLEDYLESWAREKEKEEQAKKEKADRAEKRSQDRLESLPPVLRTLRIAGKSITASMKKAFFLVLDVLKGGIKVLESFMFIATELTFQTHYEVALKAILFLMTAYDKAVELTGEINAVFDKLGEYVDEIRTLNQQIKSVAMSKATSKLFVSIVSFIASAGKYLTRGILGKMVTYAGGRNERFQSDLKSITGAYEEVMRVMKFADVMINIQNLKNTGKLTQDTSLILHQLRQLNNSMPPETSTQIREVHSHTTFHAELHVQTLRSGLFSSIYEPSEERLFNDKERIFLSPRDRWPRQFRPLRPSGDPESATTLRDSESTGTLVRSSWIPSSRPLIWITGHISRRNVSWVSALSVDLIPYFREFSNFDVAYIFCKRSGPRYTPTLLIKGLVAQLMDLHPTIVTRNVRQLSLDRFHKIGKATTEEGSAGLLWDLLMDMLRLLEEASELRDRVALLLIDRLDLCISETGFSVLQDLIPRLQNLGHQRGRVQVIITTARLPAHNVPTLKRGSEWLQAYGKRIHG